MSFNCRHGGTYKSLCTCLKHKLVHHDRSTYDGYRLTNLGYDFLAVHTLSKRGMIKSVGRQIGIGKESDLFEVCTWRMSTYELVLSLTASRLPINFMCES
jgi:RIO-like serine/threonine protein kinase